MQSTVREYDYMKIDLSISHPKLLMAVLFNILAMHTLTTISIVNIVVKKTSRYPRVIFLGDFEFRGSSAAKLTKKFRNNKNQYSYYGLQFMINSYSSFNFVFIVKTYLADETIMQIKIKFVKAEWLQNR